MTLDQVFAIMDKFDASNSSFLELELEDMTLKLKKADMAKQMVQMVPQNAMQVSSNIQDGLQAMGKASNKDAEEEKKETIADTINSPLVGVFYAAASPEKPAFVQVGSKVEKGDTVCLIEAMKMMSEVVATKSGVIKKILVENGATVQYDTPLFEIG